MALGFFDVDTCLAGLSKKGDVLEQLSGKVSFELFRSDLERAIPRSDGARGGRPPFDHVLMFKVLILQAMNGLSDEATEYFMRDRLTWKRFLGLELAAAVPDANTIWAFRERLTKAGAIKALFERFDMALREAGYLAMSGQRYDHRRPQAAQCGWREGRDQGGPPFPKRGRISLPRCARRTATPAGR